MSITIERLIGQLFIAGFRGKTIKSAIDISKYIRNYSLGGIILYDEDLAIGGNGTRNIGSPNQVKNLINGLQDISDKPLIVAIDQEGGEVNRLRSIYGFDDTPSWKHIGMLQNLLITKQYANSIASTLHNLGINLNFAPVLDLDYGEKTNIGKSGRSISQDPKFIIEHAKIFIEEHQSKKIITCGKHFPGLGSASGDTHDGFTNISKTWNVKDLLPFDNLIQNDFLDMIMISHAFDNKLDNMYPASLSKIIITEMLRNDLGYEGPVICDDPSMRAISDHYSLEKTFELMLHAGVDLFCLGNNLIYDPEYIPKCIDAITNLVKSKKITKSRILESINRIERMRKKYNIYEK